MPSSSFDSICQRLSSSGEAADKAAVDVIGWAAFAGRALDGPAPVVCFDGTLRPEHAAALERQRPALLLACSPDADPDAAHVSILSGLLAGAPLLLETAPALQSVAVQSVRQLNEVLKLAREVARAHGATQAALETAGEVAHEIAANALLAAPIDAAGRPKYAFRRDDVIECDPDDVCRFMVSVDSERMFLLAADRFGRLSPGILAATLRTFGETTRVDASGGGAGLGWRRILERSELVAVRVVPGRATEVLCAVHLREVRRRSVRPKSLFFRIERN